MNVNEIFLAEFKEEMATTRKFFAAVSDDLFEFTPHEKSKKLGELINHMILIPSWVGVIAQNTELDWSKVPTPEALTSKEAILKQFDANVIIGAKAFEETNNDQLMENWTMKNSEAGKVFFSGKKVFYRSAHFLRHLCGFDRMASGQPSSKTSSQISSNNIYVFLFKAKCLGYLLLGYSNNLSR